MRSSRSGLVRTLVRRSSMRSTCIRTFLAVTALQQRSAKKKRLAKMFI
jgi:hypothetical protein